MLQIHRAMGSPSQFRRARERPSDKRSWVEFRTANVGDIYESRACWSKLWAAIEARSFSRFPAIRTGATTCPSVAYTTARHDGDAPRRRPLLPRPDCGEAHPDKGGYRDGRGGASLGGPRMPNLYIGTGAPFKDGGASERGFCNRPNPSARIVAKRAWRGFWFVADRGTVCGAAALAVRQAGAEAPTRPA